MKNTRKMNPLLESVVADIEGKVQNRDAYDRIIVAGMKLMFSKETNAMLQDGMEEGPGLPDQAGTAIVGIMVMLQRNARGTMPFDAMLPAAVTLLMHAIDFLAQTGRLEITPEVVGQAMRAMVQALLKQLGISEEQVIAMAEQASGAVSDPQKAEMIGKHFMGDENAGTD